MEAKDWRKAKAIYDAVIEVADRGGKSQSALVRKQSGLEADVRRPALQSPDVGT